MKLQKIDQLLLSDHFYLTESDKCFFLAEYTSQKDFSFSETNQLIYNLKKSLDKKNTSEWKYKLEAIETYGKLISKVFTNKNISKYVFVPIPPSKCRTDLLFDNRLVQILEFANKQESTLNQFNIKELISLKRSTIPSHRNKRGRPSPSELEELYDIDESKLYDKPKGFVIFDDVITTGSHFKAVQNMLNAVYPDIEIYGFFIARRNFV